jgi:cholesterol oxidase
VYRIDNTGTRCQHHPSLDFDVTVIGSGFGGAVTAARLSEAGYRVLILERGRRWAPENFPARSGAWIFDPDNPEKRNGWFDMRRFPHMTVVQGAGVGGGSLVYANISVEAKPDTFNEGWPPEIRPGTLDEFYEKVGTTMKVRKVPKEPHDQRPARTKLLEEAAKKLGYGDRFRQLELAVTFDDDWRYDQADPHDPAKSKTFVNDHGRTQGTCVHLGDCDIGCAVNARNTLDLNYIAMAENTGRATVKPLHIARGITPIDGGYRVTYHEIASGGLTPGSVTSRLVIVAAGSLGSTELLLQCKQVGTLPRLSGKLGSGWSSNGDFLTPAIHFGRSVNPTRGPTITAAVDLLDGAFRGQPIFIEDGGLPDIGGAGLRALAERDGVDPFEKAMIATLGFIFRVGLLGSIMPWFAQSRDASDGVLSLKNGKLFLDWDITKSKPTIDAVVAMHQQMAVRTGGMPITPLTWSRDQDLITPHPLGGCRMAATTTEGVVDHRGEVFGHPNLYVADGAIVPKAIGLNPSRTIGALAERIAKGIITEQR